MVIRQHDSYLSFHLPSIRKKISTEEKHSTPRIAIEIAFSFPFNGILFFHNLAISGSTYELERT
jgi:hypothetical protein